MSFADDLLVALALVLVLEGLLPGAFPRLYRALLAQMNELTDRALRLTGFGLMLTGAVLLYLVRHS